MKLNSMNIGYGRMDVQENLNLHDHVFGYVDIIKDWMLNIAGISFKLDMEKVNMMAQEHA